MLQELYFNKLESSEIPAITKMMGDFYAIDHYPFDAELSSANFAKFIQNPEAGQAFIIYNPEKEIIGYIIMAYLFSFEFGGRIAFLDELYLNEKARGKGYGKIAMNFVKDFASEQELKVVFLEIEPHNDRAKQLYLNKGFQEHKRNLMIYKP